MQLKSKQDKTKPIKPNNPQISIQNIYILLSRISNVTFNHQLVLFDRVPLIPLNSDIIAHALCNIVPYYVRFNYVTYSKGIIVVAWEVEYSLPRLYLSDEMTACQPVHLNNIPYMVYYNNYIPITYKL